MKWFWGLLLITLGIVYLGPILNLWSTESINGIWEFWPLLLVLFGLAMIVRRSKAAGAIMIIGFLVAALFVYNMTITNRTNLAQKRQEGSEAPRENTFSVDAPSDVENARVEINTGAIKLNLDSDSDKLVAGKLISSFAEPKIETLIRDKEATVKLSTVSFSRRFIFRDLKNLLELKVGNRVPTAFKIDSGASDLNLDFSKVKLSGLDLNTGASSVKIKVGSDIQKDARLSFEAGASDIDIEYQKGLGVRIEAESGLAREEFEGFTKKNGYYENVEYEAAEKKITIVLRTGASSVNVKPY